MAAPSQFADALGLTTRPSAPNAVQWSADGVLAVAAGSAVVLANPANLQGPRAFASPGGLDVSVLQAPGQPADPTADTHHEVAHLRMAAMVSQYPALQASLSVRSMAWSPAGCGQAAGCLLATVASDHQVLVFGPPAGPKSQWQVVADLSQQLLDHLEATGWRDLEPHAGDAAQARGPAGDGSVLRLRGGGKRKRPAEKRQVDEAAHDEQPPAEGAAQLQETAAAAAEAAPEPPVAAGSGRPVFHPEAAFQAAVGQAVEVMSPEEGLAGSWFSGAIRELRQGWALVAYDELKESEAEDSPPLLEWFPLPGQAQGPTPEPRPPGEVHVPASAPQLRPVPPPEECNRGGPRCVGDICDCLIEGAWWEASRVVAVNDGKKKKGGGTLEVVWGDERREVPRADARSTLRFAGGRWQLCTLVGVEGEAAGSDGAGQKQQEGKGSPAKQQRAVKAATEAGAEGPPKKKRRSSKKQAAPAPAAASDPAADDAEADQHGPAATATAAAEAAAAAAAEAAEAADALMAAAASQPPTDAVRGKGKKAAAAVGASPAKKTPARAASAPYEVPANFDTSVLPVADMSTVGRAKSSLPLAFARRFLALRQGVPAEELPTYPAKSSHLKGRDLELLARTAAEILHVHGAAMAALDAKLDAKWLDVQGRQKLRQVWDRASNTLLGMFKIAEDEPSEEEEEETESVQEAEAEEDDGEGGSAPRRRAAAGRTGSVPAQLDFPLHELPEGFSWRDLPGVDPSNDSSAKRTLVLAAVRRFLSLRQEYPADELPSYPKRGAHLKGRDLWLQERVTREFTTAYSQLLADLKWTVKAYQTYWLARLRHKWNRVDGSMEAGFSLEPEAVAPDVLLAVGEQSVAPSAVDLPALAAGAADAAAGPAGVAQAASEGAATPAPSAGATPAAGRGPRLLGRASAKKQSSAATATASRGKQRSTASRNGGGESDTESQGTGLTAPAVRRKRKELAASTAMARVRQGAAGSLSSAAYERRLMGASALSCAWSPAVALPAGAAAEAGAASAGDGGAAATADTSAAGSGSEQQQGEAQQQAPCCCFLAVGAKAGRIWLWRYRLPQRYSVEQPQGSIGERFQLVACLPGPAAAWVTSLAWQLLPGDSDGCSGSLVLAAGYSDGSVILRGTDARQLAGLVPMEAQPQGSQPAAAPAAPPMQRWAEACPADQRGVTSLALQLCPSNSGRGGSTVSQHLLVAAGKAAGSLAVWRSCRLSGGGSSSAEHAKQLCSGAAGLVACGVQGTQVVTGLAWLPHQQQQEGQPLLLASTQDGTVSCYRLAGANGASSGGSSSLELLRTAGSPQPCQRRKKKEQGHCALGLAVSPGGLFAAVARYSLSPLAEIVKSMQVHERVVQGLLQLDCLAGPGAPLEPAQALEGALAALASHSNSSSSSSGGGGQVFTTMPVLPAAAAWEVAALLHLQAKQAAGPEAVLVPPEAAAVLQRLEQPAQAAVQAAAADQQGQQDEMVGGTEEAAVLPQVSVAAWRSLQLATALRHLLDPARVVKGQQQLAKKQPRRTGGSTAVPPLLPFALPQPQDVKPEDGQGEGQQQQQAAAQLSPEQLAQHGAFASLMLAAQQPPPQQQPAAAPPAQQQQQGEEADEAGGEGQAQLLAEWRAATERSEMLLLQRQLAAALTAALPEEGEDEDEGGPGTGGAAHMDLDGAAAEGSGDVGGGVGAGEGGSAESRRSQLLMADWITLNVQDPQLLPEMLPLAARAYMHHGEEIPAEMPAREASTLFSGARVAVGGAGVAAATAAPADGAMLPRCPASLLLCERRPQWGCGACGRKYQRPALAAATPDSPACAPAVPACIFCGLLLGLSRPGVLFSPPCCG